MCDVILRVTYMTNEVKDTAVTEAKDLEARVSDFKANENVRRIEVFRKESDISRTTTWVDKLVSD